MKVYVASKTKHAGKWLALRASGLAVNSTWIDEAGVGESACFIDLWIRCVREASRADALLLYVEPGDVLKGALVEVGAALGCGVPVHVVGAPDGSWVNHPLVRRHESLEDALACLEVDGWKTER